MSFDLGILENTPRTFLFEILFSLVFDQIFIFSACQAVLFFWTRRYACLKKTKFLNEKISLAEIVA